VNDDEKHLIVFAIRLRLLKLEELVDLQIRDVGNGLFVGLAH
jgi:hypothetical protein